MAKRRVKKRTHVGAKVGAAAQAGNVASKPGSRVPKSMVIRVGASEVGQSVSQLVKDVRSMMEPHTASRLKERRGNKLRDFTTMAGPLGVSHLLLFSKSDAGNVNLRIALTPRGPTLHFRVAKYSLRKDIFQSMKRPKSGGNEHVTPPLLVMNNFTTQAKDGAEDADSTKPKIPKHLESLTTSVFQSLFPPINPTTTSLKGIKRVLLLDRIPTPADATDATYTLNLRHYSIETHTAKSVPKPLRRLDAATDRLAHTKRKRNAVPNLGRLTDVADYLLDPDAADGFTSGSESEPDTDAEVEVVAGTARRAQKPRSQQQRREDEAAGTEPRRERRAGVERKAIKLRELGPRMVLRMTKVEEGVCGGKVMWHEYIHKTPEEVKEMERVHERRRQQKEKRKAEQKANVERKRAEKKARRGAGRDGDEDGDGEGEDEEEVEWDEDMDDGDDQWDDADVVDSDDEVAADDDDDDMEIG